jgi:hypothetical protein
MKLFKMEIARGSRGLEALAHAETAEDAERLVKSKYTGWKIRDVREIPGSAYFIIAELEPSAERAIF